MMQLAMSASFLILFCGLFTIVVTSNGYDAMTFNNVSTTEGKLSTSCIFGVEHVSIVLHTRDIPNGKFVQVNESCNLFNSSSLVFFMTHGFVANYSNYNLSVVISQLLKKNYTIFSLDWSDAACYNDPKVINLLAYPFAVHNTRKVGNYLASYIKSVCDTCSVPLENIVLIGHSLGAQISSFAAKNLTVTNYGRISLLIGSDPAGPLFELLTCENRFCKTDAKRVIALHTSAIGLQKSLGHVDLRFNNGLSQPACGGQIIGTMNVNCSHNIAIMYLASMWLEDCVFIGVPIRYFLRSEILPIPNIRPGCSSDRTNCIIVDNRIFYHNTIIGDYCVSVTSKYPYCIKNDSECQEDHSKDSIL